MPLLCFQSQPRPLALEFPSPPHCVISVWEWPVPVNPSGPCLLHTMVIDSRAGNEKKKPKTYIKNSCICVGTETELKSFPYLHSSSKILGFWAYKLWAKEVTRRKKAEGVGSQLHSFPLNSKVCLMTLFITWKEEWETCLIDKYK